MTAERRDYEVHHASAGDATAGMYRVAGTDVPIVEAELRRAAEIDARSDALVVANCPICGEDHYHLPEARVVLGGIENVEAGCGPDHGPDEYYLLLAAHGRPIRPELVHWARGKIANKAGYLRRPLVPVGIDPRAVADEVPHWQ